MAPLHPERRRRGPLFALITAGALLALLPGYAAVDKQSVIKVSGENWTMHANGTMTMKQVELLQAPNTVIRADQTDASGLNDGPEDSRWELAGAVHIEFDDVVLDADTAIAVFADNRLQSILLNGTPARFSHQMKDSGRQNHGRATKIQYDAATSLVRFPDGAWYSDGRNEADTGAAVYNIKDGSLSASSLGGDSRNRLRMTIRPGKRVPPPRTPEKSTAQ
jgi:lipopolysaccharide transport protein LptA